MHAKIIFFALLNSLVHVQALAIPVSDYASVEVEMPDAKLYENLEAIMDRRATEPPVPTGDSFKSLVLTGKQVLSSFNFYETGVSVDNLDWTIPFNMLGINFPSSSKSGGFVITVTDQDFNSYILSPKTLFGYVGSAYISSDSKFILGKALYPSTSTTLVGRLNFAKTKYSKAPTASSFKVTVYFVRDDTISSLGTSSTTMLNQICVPGDNMIECEGGEAFISHLPRPEWSLYPTSSSVVKKFSVAALVLSSDGGYDTNTDEGFVRGTYRYMINKQKIFDTVTNFSKYLKGASVAMISQFVKGDYSTYNKPSVTSKSLSGVTTQSSTINGRSQKVITQSNLESYLTTLLNNNELKYAYSDDSVLTYGTSTIVPIHLGPGIQVKTSDGKFTCKDLCAFHETVESKSRTVHYTLIPYPDDDYCPACIVDSSEKKAVKIMASHEFFEAMAQEALGKNYIPGTSEISDPCSWDSYDDTKLFTDTSYGVVLQKMWDFNSKECVTMKD